uniref:hypothetical protein n=1 Tax=Flavobacterium sp. TaxID=239 RepID=UPI00404925EF
MKKTTQINIVLKEYFELNKNVQKVPVAFMMPYFVLAGIYKKDDSKGTSIKNLLRNLEAKQALKTIPFAKSYKGKVYTKWYFVRADYKPEANQIAKKPEIKIPHRETDAFYILALCNKILKSKCEKLKNFEFPKPSESLDVKIEKVKVEGYFEAYQLAIVYQDKMYFDLLKAHKIKKHEEAKFEAIGLKLLEISFKKFPHNASGNLKRNIREDLEIVRNLLAPFYTKTTLF